MHFDFQLFRLTKYSQLPLVIDESVIVPGKTDPPPLIVPERLIAPEFCKFEPLISPVVLFQVTAT